jgi:ubiquinone/menaquinone biosynthesis C-methylase UbiE
MIDNTVGSDDKSALQAKFDAQKIAFAPVMFQAAKALRDLGILEYLKKAGKKGADINTVATNLKLPEYGVKVLLEAGLSLEMVRLENDRFVLTKTGFFILRDKVTQVNMDFVNDVNYLGMFYLQESVRNGKPEGLKVFGDWQTIYEGLSDLPEQAKESWFAFDHYYSDYAFSELMPLVFEGNPEKILDVGGNTGKFSIRCAEYNKSVSLTILDLPGQIKVAQENIEQMGYKNRISTIGLDLLDISVPFPNGFDIIWMSQFLDCFSQQEILGLLKRAYSAMDLNSVLYILETYWDKQRFEASTYSLHATSLYFTCMANGNSQMYHSEDMINLVDKAGLFVEESYEDIGISHTLFKCRKKK